MCVCVCVTPDMQRRDETSALPSLARTSLAMSRRSVDAPPSPSCARPDLPWPGRSTHSARQPGSLPERRRHPDGLATGFCELSRSEESSTGLEFTGLEFTARRQAHRRSSAHLLSTGMRICGELRWPLLPVSTVRGGSLPMNGRKKLELAQRLPWRQTRGSWPPSLPPELCHVYAR